MSTSMDDVGQATRALNSASQRDPNPPQSRDLRSSAALVALYAHDPETDEAGQALAIVQYRGGEEEFQIAAKLALSEIPHQRRVAADILAQLGWQDKTYLDESVRILGDLLNDQDIAVLQAAAIASGHRNSPLSVARLVELAKHEAESVRYGVAYGLAGQDDPAAIDALILLSADADRDVRDWSTFALGSQTEVDTPPLREALRNRLRDDDAEIRGEALVGLSHRHDTELKHSIFAELESDFNGDWVLEAAKAVADPDFIPALESLRGRMGVDQPQRFFDELDAALLACRRNLQTPL